MSTQRSNQEKVVAVVVTYNRKELLLRGLDGILGQTRVPDAIVIVDNCSDDGTRDLLEERGYLAREGVDYVRLDENTGATGGFHAGMERAQELGAAWFWLLDDDIVPEPDCLELMLARKDVSRCIHALRADLSGKEVIWEPIFDPATGLAAHLDNRSFRNGKEVAFVNAGCFEGMLIHADVVARIGLPDARFFIINDDTLYGFLASLHTNVICVRAARITRQLPLNTVVSGARAYYYIRNQFLVRERLIEEGLFRGSFYVFLVLVTAYHVAVSPVLHRSPATAWLALRGLADGIRGRFGKLA